MKRDFGNKHIRKNRGFTILELLVVTAIIAMVGSLIFVQISAARAKARDTEREKEIKTLQDALAIYMVNAKTYPIYSGQLTGGDAVSAALLNTESISSVPSDPVNSGDFRYVYASTDGSAYTLTYYLETNSIPGKAAGMQTASP